MARRRDQILDAATACLLRTGLTGVSTAAICAEAGLSMGALYIHFKSKSDVLRALAERSASNRRSTLKTEDATALRRALRDMVAAERSDQGKAISRVDLQFLSLKGEDDDFASVIAALRENDDFADAVQELARRGELREGVDPKIAAATVEALLMGFKVLSLMGDKHADAYQDALDLLLDGLLAKPAR